MSYYRESGTPTRLLQGIEEKLNSANNYEVQAACTLHLQVCIIRTFKMPILELSELLVKLYRRILISCIVLYYSYNSFVFYLFYFYENWWIFQIYVSNKSNGKNESFVSIVVYRFPKLVAESRP